MPNVSLTPELQEFVDREVESGLYANVSEVMRAGLRRMMEDEGAAAFYRLRRELRARLEEPDIEIDYRAELLDGLVEDETTA